jgi:hypothetical protein
MTRIPVETESQQSDFDLKQENIMNEELINSLIQPNSEYKPSITEETWGNRCNNKGMYKLFCQYEKDSYDLALIKWSFHKVQQEKCNLERLNKKLSRDLDSSKDHIDKLIEKEKSDKEEYEHLRKTYDALYQDYCSNSPLINQGDTILKDNRISELEKINKDQLKNIEILQCKIDKFDKEKSNRKSIENNYIHVERYNSLVEKHNALFYENQKLSLLKQENDRLKEDKHGLNKKITDLEIENSKVKREAEGLHESKMQLIRELTLLKVGKQSHLQHDQLYQRFKQFKEQDIQDLTFNVYSFLSDNNIQNPETLSRKQLNAIIKSHISEIVFITFLAYSNNDTIETKPLIEVFFEKLKINNSANEELISLLESTLLKGFELIKDISQATPPASFYFAVNNEESFSEHKHEANLGCVEEGIVEFTIYPAYIVQETEEKQRIFEKALVWTKERTR